MEKFLFSLFEDKFNIQQLQVKLKIISKVNNSDVKDLLPGWSVGIGSAGSAIALGPA